jgi:hypothetical protein
MPTSSAAYRLPVVVESNLTPARTKLTDEYAANEALLDGGNETPDYDGPFWSFSLETPSDGGALRQDVKIMDRQEASFVSGRSAAAVSIAAAASSSSLSTTTLSTGLAIARVPLLGALSVGTKRALQRTVPRSNSMLSSSSNGSTKVAGSTAGNSKLAGLLQNGSIGRDQSELSLSQRGGLLSASSRQRYQQEQQMKLKKQGLAATLTHVNGVLPDPARTAPPLSAGTSASKVSTGRASTSRKSMSFGSREAIQSTPNRSSTRNLRRQLSAAECKPPKAKVSRLELIFPGLVSRSSTSSAKRARARESSRSVGGKSGNGSAREVHLRASTGSLGTLLGNRKHRYESGSGRIGSNSGGSVRLGSGLLGGMSKSTGKRSSRGIARRKIHIGEDRHGSSTAQLIANGLI